MDYPILPEEEHDYREALHIRLFIGPSTSRILVLLNRSRRRDIYPGWEHPCRLRGFTINAGTWEVDHLLAILRRAYALTIELPFVPVSNYLSSWLYPVVQADSDIDKPQLEILIISMVEELTWANLSLPYDPRV